MLTPTTIFAPGSLINLPDGGEAERSSPPSFAGPGGAPPGYAPFPGQDPWSAPGGVPQPGAFQPAAPGPGNAGFAGPGGYPPGPPSGTFPGPGGFAVQGPFPGPGGYPAGGYPVGYGATGYPPAGYGTPGFDPYPVGGGAPFTDGPGAAPPGFPGGAGYGPRPGQRFPGQPSAPGYAQAPGPDPRQQPQGWHAPDGYPPPAWERGTGSLPYPGAQEPAGPGGGGYAGPPRNYAGPNGYPGFPPAHGFAGQSGRPAQRPYPGQASSPVAGGYAAAGEQRAPYPEYQAWHPQGPPGGYPGPGGYGETTDGGGYAYVIREDDLVTPPAAGARAPECGKGPGEWTPATAGPSPARTAADSAATPGKSADAAKTPTAAMRAITAGAVGARPAGVMAGFRENASSAATAANPGPATAARAVASGEAGPAGTAVPASAGGRARAEDKADDLDPGLAYGPDDPAYGPPGPDWRERGEQHRTSWAGDGDSREDSGEGLAVRGPFEPLHSSGGRGASADAGYRPGEDGPGRDDRDVLPDIPGCQPLGDEVAGPLDLGAPSDPEAGALGQVKDLYLIAETISPADLDSHFDQLLERQRQLISEYFTESGGVGSAESAPPAAPSAATAASATSVAPPDPPALLGFDTAESLTALRGELPSAP